ncbi:Transcription-repair-coupling factor [Chlamydiales bacterium STE3]|nr:Transcription-repair-coupling factor [Chlamydiales bacterium STE3]
MAMFERIAKTAHILDLEELFKKGSSVLIEELWNSPKALIAAMAQKATGKQILVLTGASQEEMRLYHDFSFFTQSPVIDFPAWETLPSENIPPSPDIVGERYQSLVKLKESQEPAIILTTLQACLQKLIGQERFEQLYLKLNVGETHSFNGLIDRFNAMGYQRKTMAADKGEFAVRGGIIDIFPVSSPDPFRIEFWGDEIESLRTYDPIAQKSIKQVESIELTPGQELELMTQDKNVATLLDYLGENTLIIYDDLVAIEDRYASILHLSTVSPYFATAEEFLDRAAKFQSIYWTQSPIEQLSSVTMKEKQEKGFYSAQRMGHQIGFEMFNRSFQAYRWISPFRTVTSALFEDEEMQETVSGQEILQALEQLPKEDFELHILCDSEAEENKVRKQVADMHLQMPKQTTIEQGYLSSGFVMDSLMLLPMTEITHRFKIRRQKQRSNYHSTSSGAFELVPGDMIVHFNHGIGRYLGIEKKPNHEGVLSEYFLVEYAESAKLYVPMHQAHLLSKYIGAAEEEPKMHTLGSNRWKRTKEQTQVAIMGYATELLEMYAKREIVGGHSYPADSQDVFVFEDEFPFVETEDQVRAISEIKRDMISTKSMDRLICGDVGYGKTEVAMRAAFKAVVDGHKQVAVLVPTTVLAMQHYENFVERMANFPLNISVLSRFRTSKEIKATLQGVAEGSVDILVGTHRIVSEDVQFHDLGLVIIDEEQRFGVKAKEHLKKLKAGVDCLTLSATPIPRTLYMSLVGARDMSVINTPPQDRLPIKTVIAEPGDQLFRTALLRELARDGQAYVIHNRVETIYDMASRIKKLLPNARIVVGHGQMSSEELDSVFHAFKHGQADILVATSIVESGIDIPNANTILIDRADRFGLADLYQLRGRVGRWNRRAYAYFLVPNQRILTEISRKRLNALAEASGHGGGMKVAMRDLEIRGAGDILGLDQSGHVSSVGFHLYCKMLKRTIQTLQGKAPKFLSDVKIDIPADARLPEDYVNDISLRMEFYQRLGEAFDLKEVDEIWKEIKDRFGPPPLSAEWLYYMTKLRIFAALRGFTLIKKEKVSLSVERSKGGKTFSKSFMLAPVKKPLELETKVIELLKSHFP